MGSLPGAGPGARPGSQPLFQRPARTPEEIERSRPLDLSPEEVAALDEEAWYGRAFRGEDVPQLTWRAVLMGSLLGFLLAFTNLYVGLKTGWGLNVAITACLMSFTIWGGLQRVGLARSPMSILEANCMQSTASSAGYSTGSSFMAAIPALLLLSTSATNPRGQHVPWAVLSAWTAFIALLGVSLAIPMKRNLINHERLPFPSGIAAAVTLQALYSRGREAVQKARAMFAALVTAALLPLLMDLKLGPPGHRNPLLPAESPALDFLPVPAHGKTQAALRASDWTMVLDHKTVMVAAGVLVGPRVALSLLLGGLLLIYGLGPAALASGAAKAPGTAWRDIGVWPGAAMLVAAGLLQFLLGWRTLVRAFRGLRGTRETDGPDRSRAIEVPRSWVAVGIGASGLAVVAVAHAHFQIPWPYGVLAVAMTFFLSLIACRATGETDITPMSAVGKVMQLTYGALIPQNATANLMTASITGSAASSSADLLIDLKAGYLLGAHPRRQTVAQAIGIVAGTLATVSGFYLLVPDALTLTGSDGKPPALPAPNAQAWLAVARVFQNGWASLHPMAAEGLAWGAAVGVGLALLETLLPARLRRFVPSATGVGFGLFLPFQYPLSMLLGALLGWAWQRKGPGSAALYLVPIACGLIAGESIVGVIVAAVNNLR